MRITTTLTIILLSFSLTQCASYDFARRIRQQGNLLPQEKIERLAIGMSRDEVAILVGTSLISPTFNDNRWDYAYSLRHGNGPLEICKLSLFFKGNVLTQIDTHA